MEQGEKIVKFNPAYGLLYILVPILVFVVCMAAGIKTHVIGTLAVLTFFGPIVFAILWWVVGGSVLFGRKKKKLQQELDDAGFVRSHTFNGKSVMVAVDTVHGEVALLFRWNPMKSYRFPASRIGQAWVDDGCGGPGFLQGSSRVRFLFTVDGVKVAVNTFTSNRRWRMDSDYILTGISKADVMVETLSAAKGKTGGRKES